MMFDEPTFLVQVGAAGKNRAETALEIDYADGVVLSPSDYTQDKLETIADKARESDDYVLFDPHFYRPMYDERDDLADYDYYSEWGGSNYHNGILTTEASREEFSEQVLEIQDDLEVDAYISPAILMESISDNEISNWADLCESFTAVANEVGRDIPIFHSLPVDGFQLADDRQRRNLLNRATGLEGDGFYIGVQYDDTDIRLPLSGKDNVYAYLELILGLRVNRFKVIASHTHQISHLQFSVGANAIAAGHYQNLRAFDTDRWEPSPEGEIRRNVPRYYSDSLLAGVRPTGLLAELAQEDDDDNYDISSIRTASPFDDDLFDSPTDTFGEEWDYADQAWEHTIYGMNHITEQYHGRSISERIDHCESRIETAQSNYEEIEETVGTVSEFDNDFYEHWSDALEEIKDLPEMRRLK